jgi:hypothetical protein
MFRCMGGTLFRVWPGQCAERKVTDVYIHHPGAGGVWLLLLKFSSSHIKRLIFKGVFGCSC